MSTSYRRITPRMVRADLRRMERGQKTKLDTGTLARFVRARLDAVSGAVLDTEPVPTRGTRKGDAVQFLEKLFRLPDNRG